MKATNVTTTAAEIVPAGNRDFVSIQNVSEEDIYLKFDGSAVALTTANGRLLSGGAEIFLENAGPRQIYRHSVWAIHGGVGDKEVRIQGVD